MQEQIISFETAKLAKEKGFDIPQFSWYNFSGVFIKGDNIREYQAVNGKFPTYLAFSQSLLQKWLREKHDIHIVIQDATNTETRKMKYYPVLYPFGKQYDSIYGDLENRNDGYVYLGHVWKESYEEALERGLIEALKLI